VRRFKDQDVPDEDILKILDSVRVGPSSENEQNWHFIVVKNKEFMQKLEAVIQKKLDAFLPEVEKVDEKKALRFAKFIRNFTFFAMKAPVLILVYSFTAKPCAYREYELVGRPKDELDHLLLQSTAMMGLGAALEHAALIMMEMGYGTCMMTSQNWADREIEELVKKETGFSRDGWYIAAMLPVGIPDGELKSPGRKPLEEMVTFYK
jgi:nitroreductase